MKLNFYESQPNFWYICDFESTIRTPKFPNVGKIYKHPTLGWLYEPKSSHLSINYLNQIIEFMNKLSKEE